MGREPDSWVLLHDNASVHYAAVVTAFLHKNKLLRCTVVAKFNTVVLLFVSTVQIKDGRKALCHDVSMCKKPVTRTVVRCILVSRGNPCIAAEGICFERNKTFPAVKYFVT